MFSVVMSAHNKGHYVAELVAALRRTAPDAELVLVDDGSTDETGAILQREADVFVRTENVWETRANNAGLRRATGSVVAIVQDDDLLTEKGWLRSAADRMERAGLGILGGRGTGHVYYRGPTAAGAPRSPPPISMRPRWVRANRWSFVGADVQFFAAPDVYRMNLYTRRGWPPRTGRVVEVDVTIRSPLIVHRSVIQAIGYLDEAYAPLGYDDHAYCMAARAAGFTVGATHIAQRSRYRGGSTWLYDDAERRRFFEASFRKNIAHFVEVFGPAFRTSIPRRLKTHWPG